MTDKHSRSLTSHILGPFLLFLFALMASGCQESSTGNQSADIQDRPTLRWEAPTFREDGSDLDSGDITEYRVYYRLRHQTSVTAISRPVTEGTSFTLNQFKPGAYEFSITAIDSEGLESRRSDELGVNLI
jgi:hypothetical protein